MRLAAPNNRVSSVNWAWLTSLIFGTTLMPERALFWSFLFSWKLRTTAWRTKSTGERGKPCLRPLEALKKLVGQPLTNGAIQGDEMQALTQAIKFWLNPKLLMTAKRKSCLTLSKAQARSSLTTMPFSFFFVAGMNGFLDKNDIVQDLSTFHKPSLILWNQFWQKFFKPVSHNFGNNFIPRITEGYRPESAEIFGSLFFWDKS